MAVSFISGGNREYLQKTTCRKSLKNLMSCREHFSTSVIYVVIGTECTCSCKFNNHTIVNTTIPSMTMTRTYKINSNKVNVLHTFIIMWLKFQNMLITGKSVCTFVDNIHISLVERFDGQHRICTILKLCFLVFCIIRWNTIYCHQPIPWSTSPWSTINTTINMCRKFAFQLHILSKNNLFCNLCPYKVYNSIIKICIYLNDNDGPLKQSVNKKKPPRSQGIESNIFLLYDCTTMQVSH